MIRRIVKIDQEKCNGCSLCVDACHEGAIGLENGKAVLLRDDYCDGLGDCLPACPTGAISFEMREALPYDEAAVLANMQAARQSALPMAGGCPGSAACKLEPLSTPAQSGVDASGHRAASAASNGQSALHQWPVQIKLVPANAAYLDGAELLIAADCAAYAHGNFHQEFINGRVVLIGCPKLDAVEYSGKLCEIFKNNIRSVTLARMSVPCCGGLENAVMKALQDSGKDIPVRLVTISPEGVVQRDQAV